MSWAVGKHGEYMLLNQQADTEAYHGRFERARTLSEQALYSARHDGALEVGAWFTAWDAVREAEVGDLAGSKKMAARALRMLPKADVTGGFWLMPTALAFARSGGSSLYANTLVASRTQNFASRHYAAEL